jgi:hypothetical protein
VYYICQDLVLVGVCKHMSTYISISVCFCCVSDCNLSSICICTHVLVHMYMHTSLLGCRSLCCLCAVLFVDCSSKLMCN